jgi:hypothetical protein
LRRLGCPISDQEDILQDVAERLAGGKALIGDAEQLYPWACTTSRNLYLDLCRRRARHPVEPLDVIDLRPSNSDVATTVEAQLALSLVAAAVGLLPDGQRRLLLPVRSGEPLSAADRQARRRLLDRLRQAAGGLLAAILVLACTGPLPAQRHQRPFVASRHCRPGQRSRSAGRSSTALAQQQSF